MTTKETIVSAYRKLVNLLISRTTNAIQEWVQLWCNRCTAHPLSGYNKLIERKEFLQHWIIAALHFLHRPEEMCPALV